MTTHTIHLVKEFSSSPYGRESDLDGSASGENFRVQFLAPALREHGKVHVDLDGYNRYGRSFLDEAFGGLIRDSGFTPEEIQNNLTYSHSTVKSIITVIRDRIQAASNNYNVHHTAG